MQSFGGKKNAKKGRGDDDGGEDWEGGTMEDLAAAKVTTLLVMLYIGLMRSQTYSFVCVAGAGC